MKILLADDEMRLRKLVATQLNKEGHNIIEAGDGQEAFDCIANEKPDLVVMDISMPKMDGLAVYSKVKSDNELSGIPIIILSAQSDEESLMKIKKLKVEHHLIKPFRLTLLIDKINSIIRDKSL
mgnify:CR=1 FL=1|jgi:DNA-binding response OmpR family regulator